MKFLVSTIDGIIRSKEWFDFYVLSYDGSRLTIAGGIDLTYYHSLEIIFEDVFFVKGPFQNWHSNTSSTVFLIPDDKPNLNRKYSIEIGYELFSLRIEDHNEDFLIAARHLSFNTDTVYYYQRTNLQENERIADFVKR